MYKLVYYKLIIKIYNLLKRQNILNKKLVRLVARAK